MIKVIAKFKGQNGSLGFQNGQTYCFWLQTNDTGIADITIMYDGKKCNYSTLKSFLNNWEVK
jgi:hypothetical protein